jgi:mannose-1-phosphate guanylyltransferase
MPSAIVLCAGFGTRLRPLTDELPKPLAPVGDRSILQHALDRLSRAGIPSIAVNVHHLAAEFERARAGFPVPVRWVVEAEIKGTAGGVRGAALTSAPVLVWNGDILVDPPIDALLVGCSPNSLCLGVAPRGLAEGTLGLDAQGRVVRLRGERFGQEVQGGDYVGVLALGAEIYRSLPERGCLFGDVALPWLRAGGSIQSVPVTTPWTDAGDLGSLLEANLAWLKARGLSEFIGESAQVTHGVRLRDALVGAGARVTGDGWLTRCVVCSGASATAPLSDAIVAPSGRVIACHV